MHTQSIYEISTSSVFLNLLYVFKAMFCIQRFFNLTKYGNGHVKTQTMQTANRADWGYMSFLSIFIYLFIFVIIF